MPIKVSPDVVGPPYEHCCFCFKASKMWYTPKDVPVCSDCAKVREPADVPSKEEWCDSVAKRFPKTYGDKRMKSVSKSKTDWVVSAVIRIEAKPEELQGG